MSDEFSEYQIGLSSPATKAVAITPNDSADLATVARAVYVGALGDIAIILADDSAVVVFTAVPAGTTLHVRAKRIRATDTTASAIVALS